MKANKKIERFSKCLWKDALKNAHYLPVDRYLLESYIDELKEVDAYLFIQYNLEQFPSTYSTQLLVCLPELWEDIEVDDLVEMIENFEHLLAVFALILLTYKYLQIDIIGLIFENTNLSTDKKKEIKEFLNRQYYNLILQEDDFDALEEDLIGIKLSAWIYIRQRLLLDSRVSYAQQDVEYLAEKIKHF